MGKFKKKELLEMLATMKKANDFIKNASKEQLSTVLDVLEQCQQAAITIGSYLETKGETGEKIVTILEDYCENIYQQSINIEDENQCRKISKKIQKQLSNVSNSIQYDLPWDKKEVVFLPYKASMWDSLESVWLAARDDENCDVYVIPIPYFDKNPDGSFGQMHYEGSEYPDYVPITSWQEYNIKTRRPDVVYIHNPYDNWNYVTSVYPDFYAEKLKNYTDELVYIPYFVLDEIEPDNQMAIDNIKHFITIPAVIYADKVIVQSEKMKQIYVNEYLKFAQVNGLSGKHLDRTYQEERILGLGSPKIDKVLNTKKEDLTIPEEWLKIIERPDGSWKKIILYNTGITALLEKDEKWVDKIEDTLKIFKENKDNIALLWRPHPLIESTMKSMKPQIFPRYRQIKELYIQEGWGIYDDTTDLDRSMLLSDAFYGDFSSLVKLYKELKKPVMIQAIL